MEQSRKILHWAHFGLPRIQSFDQTDHTADAQAVLGRACQKVLFLCLWLIYLFPVLCLRIAHITLKLKSDYLIMFNISVRIL